MHVKLATGENRTKKQTKIERQKIKRRQKIKVGEVRGENTQKIKQEKIEKNRKRGINSSKSID